MKYKEIEQSLFECDNSYLYAHCISLDLALGAGIAKQINMRYNMRSKLLSFKKQNPSYFDNFSYGFCIVVDGIANLITKDKCYEKPTLKTLEQSLISLKKYIMKHNIKKLAMPKIGCGLDRLNWEDVSTLIKNIFIDLDIEIVICYMNYT